MARYSTDFHITETGIYYDMPAEIYHSDPCPTPSLSNSLIRDLLDKSPNKQGGLNHVLRFNYHAYYRVQLLAWF